MRNYGKIGWVMVTDERVFESERHQLNTTIGVVTGIARTTKDKLLLV